MRFPGCLLLGLALGCAAGPTPATAADRKGCLSQDERRAVTVSHKAVPLGRAIRVVKARIGGDVGQDVVDREAADQVKAGLAGGLVKPGDEGDQVATVCPSK